MNRSFLWKTFNDGKVLLLACAGALFAFSWIRIIIVASMEADRFQKIVRHIPDVIKNMSPVPVSDLVNYPGLIGFTFEEPLTYLMIVLWTISRSSDSVSGEISRGTMELVLSQPISRREYLLSHSLVTILGIVILSASIWLGTKVGIDTTDVTVNTQLIQWKFPFGFQGPLPERVPMSSVVSHHYFVASCVNVFCFGFFLTGWTTALSSLDRYRWRTIGITLSIFVVERIVELMGLAIEGCRWMLNLTFFSLYEPVKFATTAAKEQESVWRFWSEKSTGAIPDLGPLGCDMLLFALGAVGLIFAFQVFEKRDLPAPI